MKHWSWLSFGNTELKKKKSFHKSNQYLCKKEKANPNATTSNEHASFMW